MNQSLQSGIFPDKLKIAKVVPIFKAGKDNRKLCTYLPSNITSYVMLLEDI